MRACIIEAVKFAIDIGDKHNFAAHVTLIIFPAGTSSVFATRVNSIIPPLFFKYCNLKCSISIKLKLKTLDILL